MCGGRIISEMLDDWYGNILEDIESFFKPCSDYDHLTYSKKLTRLEFLFYKIACETNKCVIVNKVKNSQKINSSMCMYCSYCGKDKIFELCDNKIEFTINPINNSISDNYIEYNDTYVDVKIKIEIKFTYEEI